MNSYWNNKGEHQGLVSTLHSLIPTMGPVENPRKNKALEKFRRAQNCYYDLYNNGLGNRYAEFVRVYGIRPSMYKLYGEWGNYDRALYVAVEKKINEIILNAAREQNIA